MIRLSRRAAAAAVLALTLCMAGASAEPPGQDIPPAVQQMARDFSAAIVGKDLGRVMEFYSERYRNDGVDKRAHGDFIECCLLGVGRYNLRFLAFTPINDTAAYIHAQVDSSTGTYFKGDGYQIFLEDGRWRWGGNQAR